MRILFLLLCFIPSAHAFTLISQSAETSRWSGDQVIFYYDSSCDSYRSVLDTGVQEALDLWNSVPTSYLKLVVQESSGDSMISCSDLSGQTLGVGAFLGDLQLDSPFLQSGDPVAVAATIAHEMGHVLGLGHSSSVSALMYYAETGVRTGLRLSQDDMDGITYLYPRDELGSDGIFGCASVESVSTGGGPGSGSLIVVSLFMLLWLNLRSRTKVVSVH